MGSSRSLQIYYAVNLSNFTSFLSLLFCKGENFANNKSLQNWNSGMLAVTMKKKFLEVYLSKNCQLNIIGTNEKIGSCENELVYRSFRL